MSQIAEQQPVSPREYHNFVSAQVTFSSKEENWNDIFLTRHQHPDGVEGNPRPPTTGHNVIHISPQWLSKAAEQF